MMTLRVAAMGTVSCLLIALAGCETTGTNGGSGSSSARSVSMPASASIQRGKTAEERKLEREVKNLNQITRDIVISNTVQGAVVGAVAGCALAELTGRKCANGAVVGGVAGGLFGNNVGRKAAADKRQMVQLDQTIAKLRGIQEKLSGVESNLRAVLRRQNSEIASLRRQVSAGQVSASAAKSRISSINDNRRTISSGLAVSENNLAKERATLVSASKQSGQNVNAATRAVSSTQSRVRSLRNTVQLVSN